MINLQSNHNALPLLASLINNTFESTLVLPRPTKIFDLAYFKQDDILTIASHDACGIEIKRLDLNPIELKEVINLLNHRPISASDIKHIDNVFESTLVLKRDSNVVNITWLKLEQHLVFAIYDPEGETLGYLELNPVEIKELISLLTHANSIHAA